MLKPDFTAKICDAFRSSLLSCEPGELVLHKRSNRVGARLWGRDGHDFLVLEAFKLVVAGGKGWVDARAWWDHLSFQLKRAGFGVGAKVEIGGRGGGGVV